jgi:hypothetical protein
VISDFLSGLPDVIHLAGIPNYQKGPDKLLSEYFIRCRTDLTSELTRAREPSRTMQENPKRTHFCYFNLKAFYHLATAAGTGTALPRFLPQLHIFLNKRTRRQQWLINPSLTSSPVGADK